MIVKRRIVKMNENDDEVDEEAPRGNERWKPRWILQRKKVSMFKFQ